MQIEIAGKTLVAHIDGELDQHSAANIRRELDKCLRKTGVSNLVLDFTGLQFMDSSGIGVIIGRYKIVRSIGGEVVVVSSSATVDRIITASGLKRIMSVCKTVPAAIKKLKGDVS